MSRTTLYARKESSPNLSIPRNWKVTAFYKDEACKTPFARIPATSSYHPKKGRASYMLNGWIYNLKWI